MGTVVWKLKGFLAAHGLKGRDVENEAIRLGHNFGRNSIYRLLKDDGPNYLDRKTLAILIETLRSLTRRKVKMTHLVEYIEGDL